VKRAHEPANPPTREGADAPRSPAAERPTTPGPRLLAAISRVGNANANALLRGRIPGVQAKLTMSRPGDPDEREADSVADQIVASNEPEATACPTCAASGSTCPQCAQDNMIQRKAAPGASHASAPDVSGLRGGGMPLAGPIRSFFERRFGADLTNVRVHTDDAAAGAARSIGARAFTRGSDIAFARGQFASETTDGERLLAHELTHVVQQSQAGSAQHIARDVGEAGSQQSSTSDIPESSYDAPEAAPMSASTAAQPPDACAPVDVCEAIPDNPLDGYPFLVVALEAESLQLLQDAAYRREHLRRGLPYDGPPGLFLAQAPLSNFLPPGTEYVSREELLAALWPPLLNAAIEHSDPEPYVTEIARNEAARQFLEPIGNPLVNVQMPDPDGTWQDMPTELTFTADFKQLQNDHGALPPAALDPLSRRTAYLWTLLARNDAEQLREMALLKARIDWVQERYGERLTQMTNDPADYAQNEVWELWHEVMPKLVSSAKTTESVLMPGNRDQAGLMTDVIAEAQTLSDRAARAMDAMNEFRKNNMPDRTTGEIYEDNAEAIRKAADEAWDEGGFLGGLKWVGNKAGLGSNKILRGMGNAVSGGYVDTHSARAHAYRMGNISYNDYTAFSWSDLGKGAIGDLSLALPFFGKGLGIAAVELLGLEEGTAAAGYVQGTVGGFTSGTFDAAGKDFVSLLASNLSPSESERQFQAAQIGGPLSWIESGAWGGLAGGPTGALMAKMPKPTNVPARPPTPVDPELETAVADTEAQVSRMTPQVSTMEPDVAEVAQPPRQPATGLKAWLQRRLVSKLFQAALEGSEPLHMMPRSTGSFGAPSAPLVEDPVISAVPGEAFAGDIDLMNAPDLPASAAPAAEASPTAAGHAPDLNVEVSDVQTPTSAGTMPTTQQVNWGVTPAPGSRTTTRAKWLLDYRKERIERSVDVLFAPFMQPETQQAAAMPAPAAIDLQAAVRLMLANLRTSGRVPSGVAALGTRMHAELAAVLRATQFPAGTVPRVELNLQLFNTLSPTVLQRTVDQWFQNEGRAHAWLRNSIPAAVRNTVIANLRPDFAISVNGQTVLFDLTSRENPTHLAKTLLYSLLQETDGQLMRVQEYYWIRWGWRGQ
jgi:hypothetical protein